MDHTADVRRGSRSIKNLSVADQDTSNRVFHVRNEIGQQVGGALEENVRHVFRGGKLSSKERPMDARRSVQERP